MSSGARPSSSSRPACAASRPAACPTSTSRRARRARSWAESRGTFNDLEEDLTMAPHRLPPLSRRDLLKLGGALAATGVLGLQPGQSAADGDPGGAVTPKKRGGTFRFRLAQAPPHFDPHQTLAPSTMIALSFAYSRLMRSGAGATVVPGTQPVEGDLAESWDRQGDTTYVFKLRKGVQWQGRAPVNGRELVAQDVKYTYERFLAQPGNPNRALLEMVERVDAPDKYTVKFTLREPNAWFV